MHMHIEKIFSKIHDYKKEIAEVCSQLVQLPSAHPIGKTTECVDYIKNYFDELGISNKIYKRNDDKPNIVAKIDSSIF